jgi:hypothetical protein
MTPQFDADHRNAAVTRVLRAAGKPLTPSEIALAIREPWCVYDDGPHTKTAAVSPVCKRIGAINEGRGKWAADPKWEVA